jgi:membrane-bound lytic murein transglycosylase D
VVVLTAAGLTCGAFASAQTPDRPVALSQEADDGASPAVDALASTIERADLLFGRGREALIGRREADARAAFDAALDVFVETREALDSDPRFQPAYLGMVERIHSAEVAAGGERHSVPVAISAPAPQLEAPGSPAGEEPGGTLAELGDRIENVKPTAESRQSNQAVLGSEILDLPIELNDQVLGAIDVYTGKFKEWFTAALSRGLPHLPRIREILAEAGIPQDLAYVPIVESAFNPRALSRANARGLWQFIPSTGRQYGLRQDFFIDERADTEKATLAAAQYLKNLYAIFSDWNLALAGYNAGEGKVLRAIRKAKTSDFWALAKTRSFRAETKNYVPLIHAAIMIAKSPESYGIELAPEVLAPSEKVRVSRSYPVATIARCASTQTEQINRLNPELRRGLTPSSAFDLAVPSGSGDQVTACLASERAMDYTRHLVRKRDTLSLIAKMFGVTSAEIAAVNGLTLRSRLRPGTELAIPRPARRSPAPASTSKVAAGPDDSSYTIQKGDTLSSLAARHSTTVEAIKSLNGLNSSRLAIGQVLRVISATGDSLPN